MMTIKADAWNSKLNILMLPTKGLLTDVRLILMCGACLLMGLNAQAQKKSQTEKNKACTQNFYLQVYSKHNIAIIDSLVSEDYVEHQTTKGFAHNKRGLKSALKEFFKAFPDFDVKINFMIAKNDMVVAQITMTGTNTGPFNGIPATNKKIHVDGVDIVRYKNGKAAEHWGYLEEGKILTQLGVVK